MKMAVVTRDILSIVKKWRSSAPSLAWLILNPMVPFVVSMRSLRGAMQVQVCSWNPVGSNDTLAPGPCLYQLLSQEKKPTDQRERMRPVCATGIFLFPWLGSRVVLNWGGTKMYNQIERGLPPCVLCWFYVCLFFFFFNSVTSLRYR